MAKRKAKREAPALFEQIRAAREALGKTQEAAAYEFGASVASWGRWERGVYYPDAPTLQRLADFLGTTLTLTVRPGG